MHRILLIKVVFSMYLTGRGKRIKVIIELQSF